VITKADFDGTFEAVDVTIVARSLVCLMFLHKWNELLSRPAFGLKVVVVGGRGPGVHLKYCQVWSNRLNSSNLP